MLRAVMRAGAKLDATNNGGMTALDIARARGLGKIAEILERKMTKRKAGGGELARVHDADA